MQSWDICYETKSCLTEARVTTRVAEIPACKFFALSSDLGLLSPDKDKSHRRHPMRPLSKRCRRESCMKGCGVGASSYQKDCEIPRCLCALHQCSSRRGHQASMPVRAFIASAGNMYFLVATSPKREEFQQRVIPAKAEEPQWSRGGSQGALPPQGQGSRPGRLKRERTLRADEDLDPVAVSQSPRPARPAGPKWKTPMVSTR